MSGLLVGSAVLFNGIRVGEVTTLDLDADNPRQVHGDDRHRARHAGARRHARRHRLPGPDGIAGRSRSTGGSLDGRRSPRANGEPPLLVADPTAGQSMTQAARDALRRLDARPGGECRAAAQRRSPTSTRSRTRWRATPIALDGIVAGLERMTGGAAAKARHGQSTTLRCRRVPRAERKAIGRAARRARPLGARGPRQRQDPERHAGRRKRGAARCAMERHAA